MARRPRRPGLIERIKRAFFEERITLRNRALAIKRIDEAEAAMERSPFKVRR